MKANANLQHTHLQHSIVEKSQKVTKRLTHLFWQKVNLILVVSLRCFKEFNKCQDLGICRQYNLNRILLGNS